MSAERRGLKLSDIKQFCRRNLLRKKNHGSLHKNLSKLWNFVLATNDNTANGFRARIVDVCLIQVVISQCCSVSCLRYTSKKKKKKTAKIKCYSGFDSTINFTCVLIYIHV